MSSFVNKGNVRTSQATRASSDLMYCGVNGAPSLALFWIHHVSVATFLEQER